MGDSLQEQLRALGLGRGKPERQKKRARRKPRSERRTGPTAAPGSVTEPSLDEAWALREREERRQAERSRQARLAEERRRREVNGKIRAVVDGNRLNRADAPLPRHFLFRGRIRKIYVTPEQQQALTDGQMGIVYLSGGYHLLAAEPLAQVRGIAAENVVELQDDGNPADYDHPVPDDLVW